MSNSSTSNSVTEPEKPSFFEVAVISGGALSAGFVGGVWYQFRKSKFKFNFREHHSELKFAGTAFLAGTALCLGTFGVLTSAFMYTTGVSSFLEFSYLMKSTFQGRKIDGPSEEMKKEAKIFEGMSREEEWEHWSNKFKHYFDYDEKDGSKENDNEAISRLDIDVPQILKEVENNDEKSADKSKGDV